MFRDYIVFHRWWFMIALQIEGFTVAYQAGFITTLWRGDKYGLSFVVLGLYLLVSLFVGYLSFKRDESLSDRHTPVCWLTTEFLMALGMVASMLGFILILSTDLPSIDATTPAAMRIGLLKMTSSIAAAFGTTVFGVLGSFLLRYQLINLDYDSRG